MKRFVLGVMLSALAMFLWGMLFHMLRHDGRPIFEAGMMIKGFILYLAVACLLEWLMGLALPGLPTYGRRVKFAAVAALLAVFLIDAGDVVWWHMPFDWKLQQALYDFGAVLVGGLVMAKFMPHPESPAR